VETKSKPGQVGAVVHTYSGLEVPLFKLAFENLNSNLFANPKFQFAHIIQLKMH
jgi:hypothetical protein